MARYSKFRSFGKRARTIVKYVRTRPVRRYTRKPKNQKIFLAIGALAVAGIFFKDKIKSLLKIA